MKTKRIFGQRQRWLICCVALATFSLQYVVYAACNKAGTSVACATANSACNAYSPNCGFTRTYPGTVTTAGSRTTVTGVAHSDPAGSGRTGTTQGAACTYTCTITSDCTMQSPQVDLTGGNNVTPSGTACP